MKAIVWTKYGPPEVLQLQEIEKPVPNENEVLIRIHASTVTAGDCEMRRFDLPVWIWLPLRLYTGAFKPRIKVLGQELAGEIEAVGTNVTRFKEGDQVFAPTKMSLGAHAEYICLPEAFAIELKPNNMTYSEAATIPTGGLNALHFLRKASIQTGDKVLINGAGGSIGTYAVQIAKLWGAEVTCIDSAIKLDVLRSIGADHVIDYEVEDFTKSGKLYDVVVDIVGKRAFPGILKTLNQNGRYVIGNPQLLSLFKSLWISITSTKKVINALAPYKTENLTYLKELIEEGKIRSVIDKQYPLEQMVEAHRYVDKGLKTGNVVITI